MALTLSLLLFVTAFEASTIFQNIFREEAHQKCFGGLPNRLLGKSNSMGEKALKFLGKINIKLCSKTNYKLTVGIE